MELKVTSNVGENLIRELEGWLNTTRENKEDKSVSVGNIGEDKSRDDKNKNMNAKDDKNNIKGEKKCQDLLNMLKHDEIKNRFVEYISNTLDFVNEILSTSRELYTSVLSMRTNYVYLGSIEKPNIQEDVCICC